MPKKTMRGGKFLGEGSYGCALDPAPKCTSPRVLLQDEVEDVGAGQSGQSKQSGQSEQSKQSGQSERSARRKKVVATAPDDMVGKVFWNKKSMQYEWAVSQELAAIDPEQKHFVYPTVRCETTQKAMNRVPGMKQCHQVTAHAMVTYPLLQAPHGGTALSVLIHSQPMTPIALLRSLIPVAEGLKKLGKHGIVHHDLKFDNIVYNPATKECRLIDFGLKIAADKALDSQTNEFMDRDYWLHPTEYRIITHMTQNKWKTMEDSDIRVMMARHLYLYKVRFDTRDPYTLSELLLNGKVFAYCDYEAAYIRYIRAICAQPLQQRAAFMRKFPEKIDIYSLGITLLYLSMHMDMQDMQPAEKLRFYTLIRNMVHPDPRKRIGATSLVREIKAIAKM